MVASEGGRATPRASASECHVIPHRGGRRPHGDGDHERLQAHGRDTAVVAVTQQLARVPVGYLAAYRQSAAASLDADPH